VADAVEFRGWLGADAVLDAMREATVLVHAPTAPDAMPTVLKEAMAVGTPVIGSHLAGIPEILDDGRAGILVPPGDAVALATAIERLLADPERRRELAEAGRRRVEQLFDARRNGRLLAARLRDTRRARP
jgi:glycosyltransferase involved in cell wall biosynthesis